jgi:hypothetical protein
MRPVARKFEGELPAHGPSTTEIHLLELERPARLEHVASRSASDHGDRVPPENGLGAGVFRDRSRRREASHVRLFGRRHFQRDDDDGVVRTRRHVALAGDVVARERQTELVRGARHLDVLDVRRARGELERAPAPVRYDELHGVLLLVSLAPSERKREHERREEPLSTPPASGRALRQAVRCAARAPI